ncbi:MAG: PQQ-binding-like beta-propeller repeat protein [Verrucomicrobiales bacterium]|nr:PQQ-binding-like beta-propeller repeat protein [Verrucomicrobiales bacterium]
MGSSGIRACVFLAALLGVGLSAADWPQWRGPRRDGHTPDTLPDALPTGMAPLWRLPVGHGYASPVVASNTVVYLDEAGGRELAHAVDSLTGKPKWTTPLGPVFSDEFEPGPRCTPLVDGDRVYVQTALGELQCLSLATGAFRWGTNFAGYGMQWVHDRASNIGAASRRGNTGSPLVEGDRLLVQVGSTNGAAFVAFDKVSGAELWRSQNDLTSFSSPVVGTLGGRRQMVAVTCEGLLALDPTQGALLWRIPFKTGANRNVLTPIVADDTVYYSSHTTGLRATRVSPEGGAVRAEDAWLNRDAKINLSTPVVVGRHLFGLGPTRDFICVDRDSGRILWSQPGFGASAATLAASNGRLLILTDLGELVLLAANPERYEELGRAQVCGKTFSHPAYAGGVLYVRDPQQLAAFRL